MYEEQSAAGELGEGSGEECGRRSGEHDSGEHDSGGHDTGGPDTAEHGKPTIDVPGLIMRVRRTCDLSQRDLAAVLGVAPARIARLESAPQRVDLSVLGEILALAGMRVAVLDRNGAEVVPVSSDAVRDHARRRMPAHLDLRPRHDRPISTLLHGHADRPEPPAWYHHRATRDRRRRVRGHRPESVPDQPTRADLAQARLGRHAARAAALTSKNALLDAECGCADECFVLGECSSECGCGCEQRQRR